MQIEQRTKIWSLLLITINKILCQFFEFTQNLKQSHIEGDEDFFYIYLDSGVTYDVILKNIYDEPRHIYLWKQNNDGTWTRWQKAVQNAGQPEHYHFTPSVGGKYYIQITGGGPEAF